MVGALPGPATAAAVAVLPLGTPPPRVRVLAVGKAARPMADAAVRALAERGVEPADGLVVAPDAGPSPHPDFALVVGDHPVPAAASLAAASEVGRFVGRSRPGDLALVLLSGGATSLMAAPPFIAPPRDLPALFEQLLASGADIAAMNAVRKRFLRWGAGRLAVALVERRAEVHCLVVSDVLGDDPATIASGPCVPDPLLAADVSLLLRRLRLWNFVPESVRLHLTAVERGQAAETPKPGDPGLDRVTTSVIVSNGHALRAAADRARELGIPATVVGSDAPLRGEAVECGTRLADLLLASIRDHSPLWRHADIRCWLWGGETTVTFDPAMSWQGVLGGRCQELALAAARRLGERRRNTGATARVALLAAGTDGRDGPTDAAGAVVDAGTWRAIERAGRDPSRDIAAHDAYRALDSVGALLKTGLTGTNVMDVVIGLVEL